MKNFDIDGVIFSMRNFVLYFRTNMAGYSAVGAALEHTLIYSTVDIRKAWNGSM